MQTLKQVASIWHQWSGLPASTLADGVTDYESLPQRAHTQAQNPQHERRAAPPAFCMSAVCAPELPLLDSILAGLSGVPLVQSDLSFESPSDI